MSISISNNPNKLLQKKEKRIVITQLIFKIEQFNDLMNYNILGTRIQIRVLFIFFFIFFKYLQKKYFLFALCFITEICCKTGNNKILK